MGVPQTKSELLLAIDKNHNKLSGYLASIPPESASDESMEGHAKGSVMSVCNLVAYLLGWNKLVIKWITLDAAGKPVDFPETGYKWNQLGLLAQKFYRDYSDLDLCSLRSQLQDAKNEIVESIKKRSDDDLYGKAWYGKWTMGRMISFNTSSPYANACGRLRKWAKENNLKL
ncbi:ClbS/DfsB family four-helix bundle protein [Acerihabitans sp. TG2]|uniref:ClbS/DfsB family four-helix bundle protein n=1 Tax=Acerihabitans sp. TG2 TaxID=3096008 RepID=UPI002B23E0F2|nr:ClbS/DfsB family four-helix bundle protein [Acerihabitans sp. TG2]MEA9393602.1 ClbS/DfsB family four-helix bundle protein [Acerihabitans sp. TG2]